MDIFIQIASHVIRFNHRHDNLRILCADYLSPDMVTPEAETTATEVRITEADMAAERARFHFPLPDAYAESLALERAVARALAPQGILHMHAVALSVETEQGAVACLFLADSGEGKSTHVRHWMHLLGDRARVVADDKPFLSFAADTLLVHGSPWRGKEGWGENRSLPVRCFCILRRGETDSIRRATSAEAMQELFHRTLIPEDETGAAAVLSVADKVLSTIPFWCLSCTDSPHAAEVAYNALF